MTQYEFEDWMKLHNLDPKEAAAILGLKSTSQIYNLTSGYSQVTEVIDFACEVYSLLPRPQRAKLRKRRLNKRELFVE